MSLNSLKRPTWTVAGIGWMLGPALVLVLIAAGCDNQAADNDTSNTYVFTIDMTGADGDDIFADVCVDNAGSCSVFNDNATVTMVAAAKDTTHPTDPNGVNDVFITRYHVTFIRSDGRNVPGVDVPYPFDGATTFRVQVGGQSNSHSFVIVRHQAKLESPLSELRNVGGALILSTIAQVDFYGQDGAGRQVKATGYINVAFADFPDAP